jgi:hypothetical protein
VEAVVNLIRLTQQGQLFWQAVPPHSIVLLGMENEQVEAAYQAKFNGKTLRLYKRSFKTLRSRGGSWVHLSQNAYEPVRVERVSLEYVDDVGNVAWRFPVLDSLSNLLVAVQYQTGGKDLLDEILSASVSVTG